MADNLVAWGMVAAGVYLLAVTFTEDWNVIRGAYVKWHSAALDEEHRELTRNNELRITR